MTKLSIATGLHRLFVVFLVVGLAASSVAGADNFVETVAGDGSAGYSGDGGPATAAEVSMPIAVVADGQGNLFVADSANYCIRKVDANGVISTVAGVYGQEGYTGDGGSATASGLAFTSGVAVDRAGNLYIADNNDGRIRKVDASGIMTTVAGTGTTGYFGDGGSATAASLYLPSGVAVDGQGNIYIADDYNQRIRKVDAHGIITTIAGTGIAGYSGDGGPATAAEIAYPWGLTVDGQGDVFIADSNNNVVRRVDANGIITTVAGTGVAGYSGDGGPATAAMVDDPTYLAVNATGELFLDDPFQNNVVRKVDVHGTISTIAGNGSGGYNGDGILATSAELYVPAGVACGPDGTLFIAEYDSQRVREVLFSPPPRITSPLAVSAAVGHVFTYDIEADYLPYSFGAVGLPGGLAVNATTGAITGTPLATGTTLVTLSATNAAATGEAILQLTVANPTAPAITSTPVTTVQIGLSYAYTVTASGIPSPTFALTTFPAGMTIDAVSGAITWTPSVVGSASVTVTASNGIAPAASQSFTITVTAAAWTPLTNYPPAGVDSMLLLTDGTVICKDSSTWTNWYKLTPDASGSYLNGTWSTIAPMHDQRLYFASVVMPDGRVLVGGGEYPEPGNTTVEIYDPQADSWSRVTSWSGDDIGDSTAKVLPDGRVLLLPRNDINAMIYTPSTDTWTSTANKLWADRNDEEAVTQLANGSFLVADVEDGQNPRRSQRYIPASNTWVDCGPVPANLVDSKYECGAGCLLYDGRVLYLGATGNCDIYTPPAGSTDAGTTAGTWVQSASIPSSLMADDAPAAVMTNGHVLLDADTGGPNFSPPCGFFEYDPATDTMANVPGPYAGFDASNSSYTTRMLQLPNGQVLFDGSGSQLYVYTPVGSPDPAWKPTVAAISLAGTNVYTLTGTQLNGLTEGAYYGDDVQDATNYPLVRLTSGGGVVTYARTFGFSTMGVATGGASVSTNFDVTGIALGTYSLAVVANGIASDPLVFTIGNTAPTITSAPVTTALVGQAYAYTVTATAAPAATFSLTTAPGGMSINAASGAIAWTPSTIGSATVTVTASNGVPPDATQTFIIQVAQVPVITSATAATAVVGTPFTYQITASGSPTSFSATNLPAGLTFSATSGAITGTPTGTTAALVTIGAINAAGTGTASLNLTVIPNPAAFCLVIKTSNPGTSASNQFTLPLNTVTVLPYNFTVNWGDSTSSVVTVQSNPTHTYASPGTYIVSITENVVGGFPSIQFSGTGDAPKVLQIANWGAVTWSTLNEAFAGCTNLTITATDQATAKTGNVTDFSYAWFDCSSLTGFPVLNTAKGTTFASAWSGCSALTSFPLLNTANGTVFDYAWSGCTALPAFPLLTTSKGTSFEFAWYQDAAFTSVPFLDTSHATDLTWAWGDCSGLTSFPLLNTGTVQNFSETWIGCTGLTSFPVLNTSHGTSFSGTWDGCTGLTSFPLLDTASGTDFSLAWTNCSGLTSFPLLNTGNGIYFASTWFGCTGLTSFPLLNTTNGIYFGGAWGNCSGLTSFPLLATSHGTNFSGAWSGCTGLTSFPLLDTGKSLYFTSTWSGCTGLTTFPMLNFSHLFDGTGCFHGDTLDTASYSNLIIAMAAADVETSVDFDGGNSYYDAAAIAAHNTLTSGMYWTITDAGLLPLPVITSATAAASVVGMPFSYQITATNSPTSFSATNLPAGLAISATSGAITGTPTSATVAAVTIAATNGFGTGTATLTLNLDQVVTNAAAFTLVINTAHAGTSASNQFTLPLNSSYSYNCTVTWGDTTSSVVTTSASPTHTYAIPGIYPVTITENVGGGFPAIYFNGGGDGPKVLQIANWGGVTWSTLNNAFNGCSTLTITATDQASAKTGSVTDFAYAWNQCSAMTSFPLLNTGNGIFFFNTWANCSGLTSFPLLDTSHAVIFSSTWFDCSSLTSFPLLDTQQVTDFSFAWYGCSSLTGFPLLNTGGVTDFYGAWYDCSAMTAFPLLDCSHGTDFNLAWYGCSSLTGFPLLNTSNATSFNSTWSGCGSLTSFPLLVTGNVTSFSGTWQDCTALTSFPALDTAQGNDFTDAWGNCSALTSFPLLNTANGTIFRYAWNGCGAVTSFPLIDTSKGTDFQGAWGDCTALTVFPLLNTGNGSDFSYAWSACVHLTSVPTLNLGHMTNGYHCFASDTLDTIAYSNLLIAIAANNANPAVTFDGGSSRYDTAAASARNTTLIAGLGWTITDGGAAPIPAITSAATATAQVGVGFTYQITASNSPTAWGATNLPPGLVVSATSGAITGTPTSATVAAVMLSATNAGGTGTASLTLTVLPAAPVITSSATAAGLVGVGFTYQITATNSPTAWGATNLPAGLTVSATSGAITGIPTSATVATVTLAATNAGGTGTGPLTLTLTLPPAPVITSATAAAATYGAAFSYQITATSSPTAWGATNLPAGLAVSATSGIITGIPTSATTAAVTLAATNAGGTGTVTLTLTVNRAALTVTAVPARRSYGAANPTFTVSANGLVGGDSVASATETTTATAASAVGTYPLTATAAVFGSGSAANYTITYVPGTLTIATASVTVFALSASRVYGAANPSFSATSAGLVNGDTITSATETTTATAASAVGTYPITATAAVFGSGSAGNYTITYVPGTLTITKAALTVTAVNASRAYGVANPGFTVSAVGLVNGDTVISATEASTATAASAVGTYPITATAAVFGSGSPTNYTITYGQGTLTVIPAAITVTAVNASRAFAAANPAFIVTASGLVGTDAIASATETTTATAASAVGTYPITATAAVFASGSAANYAITYHPGTLTITTAAITVTAANTGRMYGGADPGFTFTTSGLMGTDAIASVTETTTATAASAVGTYPITPGAASFGSGAAGNYTITYVSGTLTVLPAALTISSLDTSRVYGAANPAFRTTIVGLVNGDTVISATEAATATAASAVGTYPIAISAVVFGAGSAANYAITYVPGDLSVTVATLTVTAVDASRVYGMPDPVFTYTTSGLVGGDRIASATESTTATAAAAAGTYPITVTAVVFASGSASNYLMSYTPGILTVVPPVPVITSATAAAATVGAAFTYQITATDSPTAWNASGLPAGLTIDTSAGAITGIPTAATEAVVTLAATNAGGTGTQTLTITVDPPPPVITSATAAAGLVGTPFSYQITASNDPTAYTATGLPTGLVVDTGTGAISGTMTATGSTVVTLTATNAGGSANATLTISATLPAPPLITSPDTVTATVGVAISYVITATGNPTSFGVSPANPIPGASFNPLTGQITGTPTAAGIYTLTVSATNAGGSGSEQVTLTVTAPASTSGGSTTVGTTTTSGGGGGGGCGLGAGLTAMLGLVLLLIRRRGTGWSP